MQLKKDPKHKVQSESTALTSRMIQAAKTLERMVNQNIFDDIAQGQYFSLNFLK